MAASSLVLGGGDVLVCLPACTDWLIVSHTASVSPQEKSREERLSSKTFVECTEKKKSSRIMTDRERGKGKGRKDHQFSDGVMLTFWAFRSQGIPSRFCHMLHKASRFVLLAILLFLGIYPGITLGIWESRSRLFEYVHTLPYLL